jgi:threonine/homoserine/homoserine lactone efflux protein
MPDFAHWSVFIAAMAVLLAVPGPSVLYVLTQSVDHGYRGAYFASLGLAAGDLLQAIATAFGLSAVLGSSPLAFHAAKWLGAAYLFFLGIRRLRTPDSLTSGESHVRTADRASAYSLTARAFLALNPKTTLFFLALFPQVVDPRAGAAWVQMTIFGITFGVIGFLSNFLYGCVGGRFVSNVTATRRGRAAARYATAGTLIGLGVVAALAD